MSFIVVNEEFYCDACGIYVPPAPSTCRNHCIQCLASKHVDDISPGDRASECKGLMNAVRVEGSDVDKLDLIHECTRCGKIQRNKAATDDNRDAIFGLLRTQ